jgi:hypothetical protein
VPDKTNWRSMLNSNEQLLDLEAERDRLLEQCKEELDEARERFGFFGVSEITGVGSTSIRYPVLATPDKISSFNFDKEAEVGGVLQGIKGQYLIFDTGVINLRRFGGYNIELMN